MLVNTRFVEGFSACFKTFDEYGTQQVFHFCEQQVMI